MKTLALDDGDWSTSHPDRFTLGERSSGIRWIGGWEGLRDGADAAAKSKNPFPSPTGNRVPLI